MREAMDKVGGAVNGVDDEGGMWGNDGLPRDVGLLADEVESGIGGAKAGRDKGLDGAVGLGYDVGGC